jgi:hypothetical protein
VSVYLQKHISSLLNYLKTEKEYAESIEGRIMDMINYLLLLLCMIRTYKGEGNGQVPKADRTDKTSNIGL